MVSSVGHGKRSQQHSFGFKLVFSASNWSLYVKVSDKTAQSRNLHLQDQPTILAGHGWACPRFGTGFTLCQSQPNIEPSFAESWFLSRSIARSPCHRGIQLFKLILIHTLAFDSGSNDRQTNQTTDGSERFSHVFSLLQATMHTRWTSPCETLCQPLVDAKGVILTGQQLRSR